MNVDVFTLKFSINPPPPSGAPLPPSPRGRGQGGGSPSMHWERVVSSECSPSRSEERVRTSEGKRKSMSTCFRSFIMLETV